MPGRRGLCCSCWSRDARVVARPCCSIVVRIRLHRRCSSPVARSAQQRSASAGRRKACLTEDRPANDARPLHMFIGILHTRIKCGLVFFARVPVRCPRLSPLLSPPPMLFHSISGLACQKSAFQFCCHWNSHSRGKKLPFFAWSSRHRIRLQYIPGGAMLRCLVGSPPWRNPRAPWRRRLGRW